MKELNKNAYLFTRDGFKNSNNIKITDYVSTVGTSNLEFNRVSFTSKTKTPLEISNYTYVQTSTNCFSSLLNNNLKILVANSETFTNEYIPVSELKTDDWVFNYWLPEELKASAFRIDLSKYCDSFQDLKHIYMFNSSIKDLAKELDIPMTALKELLVREAAEFEEHLAKLKAAIFFKYNIQEEDSDLTSFSKLKNYIKDNFVYKLDRFINIDEYFMSFIISFFTCSRLNKKEIKGHNTYIIEFNYENNDPLYKNVLTFIKKLKLKYKENKVSDKHTVLSIYNKPLYLFLNEYLAQDISLLLSAPIEVRNYLVQNLFKNVNSFNVSFNVSIQFLELFNYYRKIISIENDTRGVIISLVEDDLKSLESNVIVTEQGYYTRVIGLSEIESDPSLVYTTVVSHPPILNYLSLTVKL